MCVSPRAIREESVVLRINTDVDRVHNRGGFRLRSESLRIADLQEWYGSRLPISPGLDTQPETEVLKMRVSGPGLMRSSKTLGFIITRSVSEGFLETLPNRKSTIPR